MATNIQNSSFQLQNEFQVPDKRNRPTVVDFLCYGILQDQLQTRPTPKIKRDEPVGLLTINIKKN